MSHLRLLLTRKQKNQLINGYIRESKSNFIPPVLIEIVRLFYNNLRSLRIDGNNLEEFLHCNKPMVTEMFSINDDIRYKDIRFRMGIYPNGLRKNKTDAIEFYIKLKALPTKQQNTQFDHDIDCIKIYYQLFCKQTESEWKGVIKMGLNEYIVWSPYMMRLSQCKQNQYKSLFFCCDIKILSLYFKNGAKAQIAKPIIMNKTEHFTWNIEDKKTLNSLHTAQYGFCSFSANFGGSNDDCWCLKYYPQGMKANDFRGAIFVRLLRKPIRINRLKVRYKIEVNNTQIIEEIKDFSDTKHSNGYWIHKLSLSSSSPSKSPLCHKYGLRFNAKIDILDIYNDRNESISVKQWAKYGISRLKPF
eukprot:89717_1